MARSIRRFGSMLGCIINTVSAKARARGIIFIIARRARRNARLRNMSTRRAAPASSRAWVTRWRTSCAWRPAKRCCSSTAAAPAQIFQRSDRERGEERRKNAARGEDEYAQGLAPGHRRIHRRETEGREKSLGADRAGLRRQL